MSQESVKDGDISFSALRGGQEKVGGKGPVGSEIKLRDREEIEGMVACMGSALCEELVLSAKAVSKYLVMHRDLVVSWEEEEEE